MLLTKWVGSGGLESKRVDQSEAPIPRFNVKLCHRAVVLAASILLVGAAACSATGVHGTNHDGPQSERPTSIVVSGVPAKGSAPHPDDELENRCSTHAVRLSLDEVICDPSAAPRYDSAEAATHRRAYKTLFECADRRFDGKLRELLIGWARRHAPFTPDRRPVSHRCCVVAWRVLEGQGVLSGKTEKELRELLGPSTGGGDVLVWYLEFPGRHVSPGLRIWLEDGRAVRSLITQW